VADGDGLVDVAAYAEHPVMGEDDGAEVTEVLDDAVGEGGAAGSSWGQRGTSPPRMATCSSTIGGTPRPSSERAVTATLWAWITAPTSPARARWTRRA